MRVFLESSLPIDRLILRACPVCATCEAGRDPQHPLWLGAVKPYVGHLEAAAGMAGVFKVVLALRHELIPPMPHVRDVNPERMTVRREIFKKAGGAQERTVKVPESLMKDFQKILAKAAGSSR